MAHHRYRSSMSVRRREVVSPIHPARQLPTIVSCSTGLRARRHHPARHPAEWSTAGAACRLTSSSSSSPRAGCRCDALPSARLAALANWTPSTSGPRWRRAGRRKDLVVSAGDRKVFAQPGELVDGAAVQAVKSAAPSPEKRPRPVTRHRLRPRERPRAGDLRVCRRATNPRVSGP